MSREQYLSNLWRWKCGLPEVGQKDLKLDYNQLRESEWSKEFENLMRNRLVLGAIRYGKIGDKNKPTYDRVGSIYSRLDKYLESGNREYLVDIANLAMLECLEGRHPKANFNPIDDGEHVKCI